MYSDVSAECTLCTKSTSLEVYKSETGGDVRVQLTSQFLIFVKLLLTLLMRIKVISDVLRKVTRRGICAEFAENREWTVTLSWEVWLCSAVEQRWGLYFTSGTTVTGDQVVTVGDYSWCQGPRWRRVVLTRMLYSHKHKLKLCRPTRHGGAWGERRYSSYSFTTSALDGGEWSAIHVSKCTYWTHTTSNRNGYQNEQCH
jgi:hypothetical protein